MFSGVLAHAVAVGHSAELPCLARVTRCEYNGRLANHHRVGVLCIVLALLLLINGWRDQSTSRIKMNERGWPRHPRGESVGSVRNAGVRGPNLVSTGLE